MNVKKWIKPLLLTCLILNMLVLTLQLLIYHVFLPGAVLNPAETLAFFSGRLRTGSPAAAGGVSGADISDQLLLPLKILYTSGGERRLVAYDRNALLQEHAVVKSDIAYIAGQNKSRPLVKAGGEEWKAALLGSAVFLDYGASIPLFLYAELLGLTDGIGAEDCYFRYMALSSDIESDTASIYFKDERDGKVLRLTVEGAQGVYTMVAQGAAKQGIGQNVFFAFEEKGGLLADYPLVSDETILFTGPLELARYRAISPFPEEDFSETAGTFQATEVRDTVVRAFSFNPDTLSKYFDAQAGIWLLVENESALRIGKNGFVEFESTTGRRGISLNGYTEDGGQLKSVLDVVKASYSFLSALMGSPASVSNLSFAGLEYDAESDALNLYFEYRVNGTRLIDDRVSYPFFIRVERGIVTKLTGNFIKIVDTDTAHSIIPLESALNMLAQDERAGYEELEVCYGLSAEISGLKPRWNAFYRK